MLRCAEKNERLRLLCSRPRSTEGESSNCEVELPKENDIGENVLTVRKMPTNAERMTELEQQLAQLDSQHLELLAQFESQLAQLVTNQAEKRALVIGVEGEITELRAEHSASEERIREQVRAVKVQQEASGNRFGSLQEELNGKTDAVTQKLDSMSNDLASVLGRFSDSDRRMQQRVRHAIME